jgi:hypothetical protein
MSGVPQRLQVITIPGSVHFQQVGQQSFISTAHSQQAHGASPAPFADGAETVTGSAHIEIQDRILAPNPTHCACCTNVKVMTLMTITRSTIDGCDDDRSS